jgi:hypothetical protein
MATDKWDDMTDEELEAELKRREVEYRNFVDAQQLLVNLKAASISSMKSELFRRHVAAQQKTDKKEPQP